MNQTDKAPEGVRKFVSLSDQVSALMRVDAQFVSTFDAGDKVYFLLREIAIEQINCAKVWAAHR